MTTTPKRKRGQHAKRHPWSNADTLNLTAVWKLCRAWIGKQRGLGYLGLTVSEKFRLTDAFVAGYRAGKDAKS